MNSSYLIFLLIFQENHLVNDTREEAESGFQFGFIFKQKFFPLETHSPVLLYKG